MLVLCYYAYFHFEHMHVNVVHAYAHMGFDTAQHDLGNRYLHGKFSHQKRTLIIILTRVLYIFKIQ